MTKAKEINQESMTIEEALTALDYTPDADKWDAKDDKAKWQEITKKKNEREVKAAKKVVNEFATSDAAGSLPKPLVAAMLRLAPTRAQRSGGTGVANVFMDAMRKLFPKKGTVVSEIDCFVATKYGRGEMRAKIRQNLKSSAPEARMWIEFDEEKESWVLLAVGAKQPKGWQGKSLDKK